MAAATGSDEKDPAGRRMEKLRLSQENVDWILARSELCADDAPDVSRYIPFFAHNGGGEEQPPLPEAYYGDPEAPLQRHVNGLCMARFARFRDFQGWVRAEAEHERNNGFVDVEYDHGHFEQTQREREQRRAVMAELLAEELADILPTFEDGDFGKYVSVYDEERREFVMRDVEGSSLGVPVFDREKKRFVFRKTEWTSA